MEEREGKEGRKSARVRRKKVKQTDEEIDSLIIGNPDARLRTERHKERGRCVYPEKGRTISEGEYVCEYCGHQ